jgi:hypothetical protein
MKFRFVPVAAALAFASPALAAQPANTITLTDVSGTGETNYPFQFGRPFIEGAIPNFPQVLINGAAANSQADVKNRYPDGSVEFAVMAVVVPTIPQNGSVTLTFQNAAGGNNTPLTPTQMEQQGAGTFNFNVSLTLQGYENGSPYGNPQTVTALDALQHGKFKYWTQGQVAQTMILGDDSANERYDTGWGDGHHALRPHWYATFWPQTNQVSVRVSEESGLASQYEDMAYKVTVTGNAPPGFLPVTEYTADLSGVTPPSTCNPNENPCPAKIHYAGSEWTQRFWLNGAPNSQVNIDNNLAYLESTRFLPNFDTSVTQDPTALATEAALWTGKPHDIYDGVWDGGLWTDAMGTTGARPDIGPYPTWTTTWLKTGDYRMRQMALGMADLAASWSYHIREDVATKTLLRTDLAGSGTALGRPLSIIARPTLLTWDGDLQYGPPAPADALTFVGAATEGPWTYEGSHEPAMFYPQYVLTGDPWYLGEMQFIASWDAARYIVGSVSYGRGPDGSYAAINDETRGFGWVLRDRAEAAFATPDSDPEKVYLGTLVNDALAREEGVFGITGTPYDGSTMKNWGASTGDYWTTNGGPNNTKAPTLNMWESDGNPTVDNSNVDNDVTAGWFVPGAVGSETDPWMVWYSIYSLGRAAELGFAAVPFQEYSGAWLTGLINNSGLPTIIAAYEVPSEKAGGGWTTSFTDWFSLFTSSANSSTNQFLTCSGTMPSGQLCLHDYFAAQMQPQGRTAYAMAALAPLVDEGAPNAATAWGWMQTNVQAPTAAGAAGAGTFATDPSFDIVPRTDSNVLPSQPTALQ